jgi:hypothetical protein
VTEAAADAVNASAGIGEPNLSSASAAFFFQSARRNRSIAVVYQRMASSLCAAFSSTAPSSNATIASRVFA